MIHNLWVIIYYSFLDSSEHKPAGSGSGFDPFSLGPSSVGPDRFSPFGSVQTNGVGLDRNNGPDRTETNSRPHSNHSSNSGGQTGSISGLGPSFGVGNSLLSQLEKARPSPPGISTNQIPSGPPGLGVSQIGSGPQKLDLGNSLPTRFVSMTSFILDGWNIAPFLICYHLNWKGSNYNFAFLDLRHSNRNHILILSTSKSQQWFKDCPMVGPVWVSVGVPGQDFQMERDRFRCQVHLGPVRLVMERDRDSIYLSQNHHSQWTLDHNHLRNGFWNDFNFQKIFMVFYPWNNFIIRKKAWFGSSQRTGQKWSRLASRSFIFSISSKWFWSTIQKSFSSIKFWSIPWIS